MSLFWEGIKAIPKRLKRYFVPEKRLRSGLAPANPLQSSNDVKSTAGVLVRQLQNVPEVRGKYHARPKIVFQEREVEVADDGKADIGKKVRYLHDIKLANRNRDRSVREEKKENLKPSLRREKQQIRGSFRVEFKDELEDIIEKPTPHLTDYPERAMSNVMAWKDTAQFQEIFKCVKSIYEDQGYDEVPHADKIKFFAVKRNPEKHEEQALILSIYEKKTIAHADDPDPRVREALQSLYPESKSLCVERRDKGKYRCSTLDESGNQRGEAWPLDREAHPGWHALRERLPAAAYTSTWHSIDSLPQSVRDALPESQRNALEKDDPFLWNYATNSPQKGAQALANFNQNVNMSDENENLLTAMQRADYQRNEFRMILNFGKNAKTMFRALENEWCVGEKTIDLCHVKTLKNVSDSIEGYIVKAKLDGEQSTRFLAGC